MNAHVLKDSREIKKNKPFDNELWGLTTIIKADFGMHGQIQASGFYYSTLSPKNQDAGLYYKQNGSWQYVEAQWLITNRHVVLREIDGNEVLPDTFIFCIREQRTNSIDWVPITLSKDELIKRLKLHKDTNVDIAAVNVSQGAQGLFFDKWLQDSKRNFIFPIALNNETLPNSSPITIDATSDVIVASYPKGFYDQANKFPIVKSGIVASAWGLPFNGKPIFLIDAQLFPGSSGGLVISKPSNITMIDEQLAYSKTKQFAFLGVYSGEPVNPEAFRVGSTPIKGSYGLGNVWYSYLVPDIIKNGVQVST